MKLQYYFFIFLLSGCAGPYPVSQQQNELQYSLTEEQATEILQQAIVPGERTAGIYSYSGFSTDELHTITKDGFYYNAYKKSKVVEVKKGDRNDFVVEKSGYYKQEFLFGKITKIRVMLINTGMFGQTELKGDYSLRLSQSGFASVSLDVHHKDLDKVLAAFSVLSPGVRILQGIGL